MRIDRKFGVRRKKHYNPNKGLIFKKDMLGRIFTMTLEQFNKVKKRRAKNKVARKQRRINRINSK